MNQTTRHVVRLLRTHGSLSRSRLARQIGLTRAAMTNTINPLLEDNLVRPTDCDDTPRRGRLPELLKLTGRGLYTLGIDVATEISLALVDASNHVVAYQRLANPFHDVEAADTGPGIEVCRRIDQFIAGHQPHLREACIAFSGGLSEDGTRFARTNNFAGSEQANRFKDQLEKQLGVPVSLEHVTNAAVTAERWTAPDRTVYPNLLYIGQSMGLALTLNGQLYRGPSHWLRSIGEIQVDPAGQTSPHHLPGCLAATASITAMTDRLAGYTLGHRPRQSFDALARESEQLFDLYEQGEARVTEWIRTGFTHLGLVLRNWWLALPVDTIILGGWSPTIARDGAKIIEDLFESTPTQVPHTAIPQVRPTRLGDRQQAIGAALVAMEHFLARSGSGSNARRRRAPRKQSA